jgi:hypothetical protein
MYSGAEAVQEPIEFGNRAVADAQNQVAAQTTTTDGGNSTLVSTLASKGAGNAEMV